MPTGVARLCLVVVAAVVALGTGGCSSSAPATVLSGSANRSVEEASASLVDVASPGEGWTRATVPDLAGTLVGAQAEAAPVVAAPIAYVRADDGTIAAAVTGWTATVPPSAVAQACEQLRHWLASAEDAYGLVASASSMDGFCQSVLRSSAEGVDPGLSSLVAVCAAAVPAEPTTCARIDVAPADRGTARLLASVSLQS